MTFVDTLKGRLPMDCLTVVESKTEGANDISVSREWYHEGELVRRDAWVTILAGLELAAEKGM